MFFNSSLKKSKIIRLTLEKMEIENNFRNQKLHIGKNQKFQMVELRGRSHISQVLCENITACW